ncbi:hypothetical protein FCM35_KLT01059 [Carex littledalei]|uniref:Uncharacterized protein n=1 Tax=Carex littledalei TaxID=544730 RepID=A0A833REG8_9POAL|nr:hypothetical protein FCM35_KLT01059 [Carex littledalei]
MELEDQSTAPFEASIQLMGLTDEQRARWADMEDEFEQALLSPQQPLHDDQGNTPSKSNLQDLAMDEAVPAELQEEAVPAKPHGLETEPTAFHAETTILHAETADFHVETAVFQTEPAVLESETAVFQTEPAVLETETAVFQPFPPTSQHTLGALPTQADPSTMCNPAEVAGHSGLRRSARISKKGSSAKPYKIKGDPKNKDKAAKTRAINKKVEEAAVLEALRDEVLATKPLEQEQVAQINSYCGVMAAAVEAEPEEAAAAVEAEPEEVEPEEEAEPEEVYESETDPIQPNRDDAYEDDETVLAGLNYESDDGFLEGDDEGDAASL